MTGLQSASGGDDGPAGRDRGRALEDERVGEARRHHVELLRGALLELPRRPQRLELERSRRLSASSVACAFWSDDNA